MIKTSGQWHSMGVDVVLIHRIQKVLQKYGQRFVNRVVTPHELAQRPQLSTHAPTLARRWAIKEAVAKAIGTGIGQTIGFHNIHVAHTPQGQPQVSVTGYSQYTFLVSVADDTGVVFSCCLMQPHP